MDDLISRQATYLALVEKGQASKRYKLGETWELNGEEIREVLDALPSTQPEKVKCEKCRYVYYDKEFGNYWCDRMLDTFMVEKDGYCKWGK